ncbi:cobalt ECF transporter T component CbiQ [Paenibacillus abyssi]|uniref:Cobalt ECF transporter T component CbiQ n=1 Tax=Paenibacillus abyssi TaxID=1340531 RepID=A0A917G091_9BACL|nr:cobalt ECF transporter T component CbiQ [Paenibacillus abyssi]GGG16059.1 cobalt ECF transporter T component CbiQ [Paenibacillus abyssi]
MIRLIDTVSHTNKLRFISPMWKSGFAAALIVMAYLSHPVVQLLIVGWMFIWTALYAGISVKLYSMLIGSSCLFYTASLPAILIEFQAADSLAGAGGIVTLFSFAHWTAYVSDSGIHKAGILLIRIIACLSCFTFLMLSTPMSGLFQVMKKMRMPSIVLELMLIMYRFLFLLGETALQMYTAQRARGGHIGFRSKMNDMAILIVRLFGRTMHRYKALSHGLVARGFTEDIRMAPYQANPVPVRYQLEIYVGIILLLLIELWLRWR